MLDVCCSAGMLTFSAGHTGSARAKDSSAWVLVLKTGRLCRYLCLQRLQPVLFDAAVFVEDGRRESSERESGLFSTRAGSGREDGILSDCALIRKLFLFVHQSHHFQ